VSVRRSLALLASLGHYDFATPATFTMLCTIVKSFHCALTFIMAAQCESPHALILDVGEKRVRTVPMRRL
jgi:hypothetical protein